MMSLYSGQKPAHKASALVNVLCAFAIMLMIMPPALTSLRQASETVVSYYDRRYAENKISMALALLRDPVFYCGISMPLDKKIYKKLFMNSTYEPFCWDGPIKISSSLSGTENGELRIAYGVPSGIRVIGSYDYGSSKKIIKLSRSEDEERIMEKSSGPPKYVKNVVMFARSFPPSMPLVVRDKDRSMKVLQAEYAEKTRYSISEGDELIYFRAIRAYSYSGILYTDDYRISGIQPRVDGIEDISFDFDSTTKILNIYVLARGIKQYSDEKPIMWIENCPQNIVSRWQAKKSPYRRYARKVGWRLSNCISAENIQEASSL